MESAHFTSSTPLTLGAELELQLLDPATLDLKAASPLILGELGPDVPKVKPELFQSMLEINTDVCRDAHEVRADLAETIALLKTVAARHGVLLASAGTHAFAPWSDHLLYPSERYTMLLDRNQWLARRLAIFALHLHVGMPSGEHAIAVQNALQHHLPVFLALSASSPYWQGHDTGLASCRITAFEAIPTGGHPCLVRDWTEFQQLEARLHRAKAITSLKDLWWDIRPNPRFGTIEVRICDALPTLDELCALVALIHVAAAHAHAQVLAGAPVSPPPIWITRENKWRASRHGVGAELIVDEEGNCRPLLAVLDDLLDCSSAFVRTYRYEPHVAMIRQIVARGPSYVRQRAQAMAGANMREVMQGLAREFALGSPQWSAT